MHKTFRSLFCLLFVCSLSVIAQASERPQYQMPRSEVITIQSKALGRAYDLYIKLPPAYKAERNGERLYPVLYVNDSHYTFQTVAGITHVPMLVGAYEHVIIVGISFAHGEGAIESRSRDFTPFALGAQAKYKHGAAGKYLAFLQDEVIARIDETYRTDRARRTLIGQSYGGLFGAYVLLTAPNLFDAFILSSPSLWSAGGKIFDLEGEVAKSGATLVGRVYLSTGAGETPAIQGGRHDLVADQIRFANLLRARGHKNLEVRDEIIDGATHPTTFPIGVTRALMWLHEGPNPRGW